MDFLNVYITIIAWLAFNAIKFSIIKDKFDEEDKPFPFVSYVSKSWDNWLSSVLFIPILLWLGYKQMHIIADPLSEAKSLEWSDFYYLFSGVASEIAIDVYKAWRKTKA